MAGEIIRLGDKTSHGGVVIEGSPPDICMGKPIAFVMHRNDNYEYTGAEKRLAERGFLEVDSCSVDAAANCVLYYTRGSSCLRVDTVGEQVRQMTVTRWVDECAPEGPS